MNKKAIIPGLIVTNLMWFCCVVGGLFSQPPDAQSAPQPAVAAALGMEAVGVVDRKVDCAEDARTVITNLAHAVQALAVWEATYKDSKYNAGANNEIVEADLEGTTKNISVQNLTDVSTLAGQVSNLFSGAVMEKVNGFKSIE